MNIDKVLEKSKDYELITVRQNPLYERMTAAIEIIKQFIIDRGLIIYGGTGLDYALRLKGDRIYPDEMLAVPDLDFFSSNNVKDSYELADILYKNGFKDARAIYAMHIETQRVDIAENNFLADISYKPKDVFDSIPTINYQQMKIVHPDFQRVDLHSSLAFPYDNSPTEVIFQRWNKDLKRFNLINKYYPIIPSKDVMSLRSLKVKHPKHVLSGFAAYSLIYFDYARDMVELGAEIPKDIIVPKCVISSEDFIFDTLDQKYEVVHFDPEKAMGKIADNKKYKHYETYGNIVPERYEVELSSEDPPHDKYNFIIYSTEHRLLSCNTIAIGDTSVRVCNVQYLLRNFMANALISQNKVKNTYLAIYTSLLSMINSFENALEAKNSLSNFNIDNFLDSPLFLSIDTYGTENINLARNVILNRLYNDIEGTPLYKMPWFYYPGKSIPKGLPHPEFNPEENEFFRQSGREIKKESPA
jgi:hypothetical protein